MFYHFLREHMDISPCVATFVRGVEAELSDAFAVADDYAAYNQLKVLDAMQRSGLSDIHFNHATGYGYNDGGREALEKIYARVFKTEAALCRPQLISGTHALTAALFGNLRPGDELVSVTGKPYDTLEGVIGIRPARGSLAEYGVTYKQVDLQPDGRIDFEAIERTVTKQTKMAAIQRSKGYAWRPSLTTAEINRLITFLKEINPNIICMVDNCYGELVEPEEPASDLIVGSLIKNPGGGLAPTGGYVAGRAEYVEAAAERLTSPGLGSEVGPTLGLTQPFLQGLFMAPQVVGGCVKAALLTSAVFDKLGFAVLPNPKEPRADIVQAIRLESAARVVAFCEGIQRCAPVDGFVKPEPAPMPGYDVPVIMAAGAFVQGASIELSADAPMKPPYIVYFQGCLTWPHGRAGVVYGLDALHKAGLVTL